MSENERPKVGQEQCSAMRELALADPSYSYMEAKFDAAYADYRRAEQRVSFAANPAELAERRADYTAAAQTMKEAAITFDLVARDLAHRIAVDRFARSGRAPTITAFKHVVWEIQGQMLPPLM